MRTLFFYGVKFCLVMSVIVFCGCTFYVLDPQYYKARKYAKDYSGTYVLNKELYDEIVQKQKDSKANKTENLKLEEQLFSQIKHGRNEEWLQKREYYLELAYKHSGYYNEKNAQRLFVLDTIHNKEKKDRVLSNGNTYYNGAYSYDGAIEIPESLRMKIGGLTTKNMKFQQVVYPQFFYIDDHGKAHLISIGILYRYVNINRVYGLKEDAHIESVFANGEWLYLRKNKVRYIDLE
ncbi:hypothetical protein [Helicobacter trogontum]|uniref:Lipoprotein n=1 Tax=Helicobacter trogontum TaxID=50960 RepID=A0A4U8S949_9HELI|nr:hypothetical protein [Helicobacter trogontum]TLD82475.1 hypothetical protein LS81_008045 [Helicobacter trogontum]